MVAYSFKQVYTFVVWQGGFGDMLELNHVIRMSRGSELLSAISYCCKILSCKSNMEEEEYLCVSMCGGGKIEFRTGSPLLPPPTSPSLILLPQSCRRDLEGASWDFQQ